MQIILKNISAKPVRGECFVNEKREQNVSNHEDKIF